jgi:acetyl-CoA carboxylase biotin carboxyl carrier protein
MSLTYSEVGEILKMIESSSCSEVILELDGVKLVVRRGAEATISPAANVLKSNALVDDIPVENSKGLDNAKVEPSKSGVQKATVAVPEKKIVRSPMVGTFYSKPSPDEAPFVVVGQSVKKHDTLCLIEVMKLFTSVDCPRDSVIASVFVEDGELVEFDQALFSID